MFDIIKDNCIYGWDNLYINHVFATFAYKRYEVNSIENRDYLYRVYTTKTDILHIEYARNHRMKIPKKMQICA